MGDGKKDTDDSIELSLKGDLAKGNVEAKAKVGAVTRLFRSIFPSFTARGRLKHTMVDNIERQLVAGKSIAELSKADQLLIAGANLSELRRAANREQILDRAARIEPKVLDLFETRDVDTSDRALLPAPNRASPSGDEPEKSSESADEQQYFWERFWADAEVVSVEYIQQIYASIAAGKVRAPAAFSLKTLDVLRYLDANTARLFRELGPFVVEGYHLPDIFDLNWRYHVGHLRCLQIAELLLESQGPIPIHTPMRHGAQWLRVLPGEPLAPSVYILTPAAIEFLRMLNLTPTRIHTFMSVQAIASAGTSTVEVAADCDGPFVDWQTYFEKEIDQLPEGASACDEWLSEPDP